MADKVTYSQVVRQLAEATYKRLYPRTLDGRMASVARDIAEQYVSIAEAESVPRLTFRGDILERACEVCAQEDCLKGTAFAADYEAMYPQAQQVLESVFLQMRGRRKREKW
jgi:hypothetical protein